MIVLPFFGVFRRLCDALLGWRWASGVGQAFFLEGLAAFFFKAAAPLLAFFSAAGFFAADFFVVFAAGFFAAGLGGGTELAAAFEPLTRFSQNERPASVVVFTDGRGDFPPESAAQGIPVLWLFTEQGVQAPWGKAAWLGGGNGNEQK